MRGLEEKEVKMNINEINKNFCQNWKNNNQGIFDLSNLLLDKIIDNNGEIEIIKRTNIRGLFIAILSFMRNWLPKENFNLSTFIEILKLGNCQQNRYTYEYFNGEYESALDLLFQQIETGCSYISVTDQQFEDFTLDDVTSSAIKEFLYITKQLQEILTNQNVDKTIHGLGILKPKKGFIDIPSCLVNNFDNYSAWNQWKEKGCVFNDPIYRDVHFDDNGIAHHDLTIKFYKNFQKLSCSKQNEIFVFCLNKFWFFEYSKESFHNE